MLKPPRTFPQPPTAVFVCNDVNAAQGDPRDRTAGAERPATT